VLFAHDLVLDKRFAAFNVATGGYIAVLEISKLTSKIVLGEKARKVEFEFTSSDRGGKGDVPFVRLNYDAIRATCRSCAMKTRQPMAWSMQALLKQEDQGLFSS
jgi:hypothetical protein